MLSGAKPAREAANVPLIAELPETLHPAIVRVARPVRLVQHAD